MFLPDFLGEQADLTRESLMITLEPMMTLAAIARETERIGLVATGSTTFNEPFNIARQFKALDVMSHGRAGWNAVTTSDPAAAANYGQSIAPRPQRYQRAHETIQIIQALWGSWQQDAWVKDTATGRFADPAKIQPINLQGEYVASRGPLPIPPSEQGQPVIFYAGGGGTVWNSPAGTPAASSAPFHHRGRPQPARSAPRGGRRAGRDPDEVKFFAGVMPAIAPTRRDALDRRVALDGLTAQQGPLPGLDAGPDLTPASSTNR